MIEITWATAFLMYLLMAFLVLFSLWLKSHFDQKKRKLTLNLQTITICEYCHSPYTIQKGEKLSRCPTCHSISRSK